MLKPDWSSAPVWAKWCAMDANGSWWWHSAKPEIRPEWGDDQWTGCWGEVSEPFDLSHWRDTLEERPT